MAEECGAGKKRGLHARAVPRGLGILFWEDLEVVASSTAVHLQDEELWVWVSDCDLADQAENCDYEEFCFFIYYKWLLRFFLQWEREKKTVWVAHNGG